MMIWMWILKLSVIKVCMISLGAGHVEERLAHPGVALDADSGAGQLDVGAQGAGPAREMKSRI